MASGWLPDVDVLLAQGRPYPPALTGLRGSHAGRSRRCMPCARAPRSGKRPARPPETGEEYDLVVVGAGISGLAAAHYFRQARPDARILVLDNHDDFGGHAKRNEFSHDGRTYIGYGGTQSIDSPAAVQRGRQRPHHRSRHRRRGLRARCSTASSISRSASGPACSSTRKPSAPTAWWSVTCGTRRFARRLRSPTPSSAISRGC